MPVTYEEIESECEQLTARLGKACPPEAKATMSAFRQHAAGLAIRSRCIHCNQLLTVTLHNTAWIVSCPCGRSKDKLRGI
jgi:hypothetical protein